jgi:hypothetical protein
VNKTHQIPWRAATLLNSREVRARGREPSRPPRLLRCWAFEYLKRFGDDLGSFALRPVVASPRMSVEPANNVHHSSLASEPHHDVGQVSPRNNLVEFCFSAIVGRKTNVSNGDLILGVSKSRIRSQPSEQLDTIHHWTTPLVSPLATIV